MESIIKTELGKISAIKVGLDDGWLGIKFVLEGTGWGVTTSNPNGGAWFIRPPHAKWSVEEQKTRLGEDLLYIGQLLTDAKVTDINNLIGKPIQATFNGSVLCNWRILTEVL